MSNLIKANQITLGEKKVLTADVILQMKELSDSIDDLQEEQRRLLREAEEEAMRIRQEAEKVLQEAVEQSHQIIDDATHEMEVKREEIFDKAKEEGYIQGVQDAEQAMEQMLEAANQQLAKAEKDSMDLIASVEPHMVSILKGLVEKVLNMQSRYDDEVLLHLIRQGFADQKIGNQVKIKVSPEQSEYLQEHLQSLYKGISEDTHIEIIEDVALEFGDCILETASGHMVLSLGQQIEGIKEYINLLALEA